MSIHLHVPKLVFTAIIFAVIFNGTNTHAINFSDCLNEQFLEAMRKVGMIDVDSLLGHYRYLRETGQYPISNAKKLTFKDKRGRDVYNPTSVFKYKFLGKEYEMIIGRTEETHLEVGTESIFYIKKGKNWYALPMEPTKVLKLQDPFYIKIKGELFVGGVETFPLENGKLGYRTAFYRDHGKGIENLTRFANGPDGMKDIRLIKLPNGKFLVMTRPQGGEAGPGKIAWVVIDKIDDLNNIQNILSAKIIENQFSEGQWGGSNELHLLKNGKIGVLGHISKFDQQGNRHYYPMSFEFDPKTGKASAIKILLERADLPNGLIGKSKREDLQDVLFSGGLVRHGDGTATLFVGAGDAEVYKITIPDPFND